MKKQEKNGSKDRRSRYTQKVIRETLLAAMRQKPFSKITVTEICRQSDINRGTFYLHYYDLDDVLDDIIGDILQDTTHVMDQVLCPMKSRCTYPFCQKIRENRDFQILFFDDVASAKLLEKLCELSKESFITALMRNSLLSYEEAEAILYFQMNGCLAINKQMLKNSCQDWEKIQRAIDHFIKSGLESFLVQDERRESSSPSAFAT